MISRVLDIIESNDALKQRYLGMDGVPPTFRVVCDMLVAAERRGGDPLHAAIEGLAAMDRRISALMDRLMAIMATLPSQHVIHP